MEENSPIRTPHDCSTPEQDTFFNSVDYSNNELMIVNVDIGDGVNEQLVVHENDNIDELAMNFCHLHGLGAKARMVLSEEIEKHLQNLYSESLSRLPESSQQIHSLDDSLKMEKANKGEELYMRGVKMRQKTENKNQNMREDLQKKEFKGTTFRPVTNSPDKKRTKPPEQILLEKGRKTFEMLQKKRKERDLKMMDNCTFSPEVNKKSVNMKRSQMRSPDRFKCLYQDAQTYHEKLVKKSIDL